MIIVLNQTRFHESIYSQNPGANTDTEGTIEDVNNWHMNRVSVLLKWVEFIDHKKGLSFPRDKALSVIMRCRYLVGVHKAGFDCT